MSIQHAWQRLGWQVIVLILVLLSLLIALVVSHTSAGQAESSGDLPAVPSPTASAAVRTAGKSVCPALVPALIPAGMTAKDRELVPFSSTILGVDATWESADGARSIEMVDGGYVDDITEPYDGLTPIETATSKGNTITVLTAIFLQRPVYLGYWRQAGVSRPCDVHALATIGLTQTDFNLILQSLR